MRKRFPATFLGSALVLLAALIALAVYRHAPRVRQIGIQAEERRRVVVAHLRDRRVRPCYEIFGHSPASTQLGGMPQSEVDDLAQCIEGRLAALKKP